MEIIGYCGTFLVVAAMLMTSMTRLRLVNIVGSFLSVIYCIYSHSMPVALMNACLILINVYRLIDAWRKKKAEQAR